MSLGTPTYPTTLDTAATIGPTSGIVAGTTLLNATGANQGNQLGITNNLITAVLALQAMVGITSSAVTSSLDYRNRKRHYKVWVAGIEGCPSATNYGVFGTRNQRPYLAFNHAAVTTTSLFFGMMPLGAILTNGVIVRLQWMAATATSGSAIWQVAIERLNTDQDADSFSTPVTGTTACSATSGIAVETAITTTNLDGTLPGEPYCLQVQRTGSVDTLTGDAQLTFVSIEGAL